MEAPNWTKEELMAYVLLYAAHSDLVEDNHERNIIADRVDRQTFQAIHDEFSADNDFQSIQKILASIEKHDYNKDEIEKMLIDIKALFYADGDFDIREHSMLMFLKRLLN
jgi:ABC-type ATPase with predicted acetyltransferase domain